MHGVEPGGGTLLEAAFQVVGMVEVGKLPAGEWLVSIGKSDQKR